MRYCEEPGCVELAAVRAKNADNKFQATAWCEKHKPDQDTEPIPQSQQKKKS